MEHAMVPAFAAWESFYVIVGSSAAALTGLQFVVIVLGAEVNALSRSAMRAFATPVIVHFCATLLVSAILSAPWHSVAGADVSLGTIGGAALVYLARAAMHARKQADYVPVLEDWLWHFLFPALGYLALLVAAVCLPRNPSEALFVVGGAALVLLFVGIHNSWDAVTYIALDRPNAKAPRDEP